MAANEKLGRIDLDALRVITYGDPRLQTPSAPVEKVGAPLRALAERMFELMFEARGVGLAAPQVGVNVRMFVASPSFQQDDRRVYVNPQIIAEDGWQENEEGCLSLPGVSCNIKRRNVVTIRATSLDGEVFEETGSELTARIFQHEIDHLDGVLLVDRMNSVAKLAHRRTLADLKDRHASAKA